MVAYYMFHKHKMLPSTYLDLDRKDKAVVIAFIQEKIRVDKEEQRKQELKAKQGRKKR